MYSRLQIIRKFISYYITASNGKGHGIHSPFIFDFIIKVLNDKTDFPEYKKVENLRNQLAQDNRILKVEDFGAGSSSGKSEYRSVSSIAKNAAKPKKFGQLLFRMVKYYQPSAILELGTSLGITTSYLSLARPDARLITMEGSKEIAEKAKQNFLTLELLNTQIKEGNFDKELLSVINQLSSVDFAFIDGNHRLEPTVKYFNQLLEKRNAESIFIFDDIHWSSEMEEAWKKIRDHRAVTCSIDLFFIGIVFFRKEFSEKQHFVIRY
jgi:predicted O-methyltransferase YrrM